MQGLHRQLDRLPRSLDGSALVFPTPSGRDFRWAKETFLAVVRAAQIDDFRFHDLRHTFASRIGGTQPRATLVYSPGAALTP